jgi:hypothetical protein
VYPFAARTGVPDHDPLDSIPHVSVSTEIELPDDAECD